MKSTRIFGGALALTLLLGSCEALDEFSGFGDDDDMAMEPASVDFNYKSTFTVGGDGSAEISAFDPKTDKLFVVNTETDVISVFDLTDVDNPVAGTPITFSIAGAPNSVAVNDGRLAVALEADTKQDPGAIELFDTDTQASIGLYTVGALPDMVTFTPDGEYIVCAGEGEPNDDYTVDPNGTVGIIELDTDMVTVLDFTAFNGQEAALEEEGFRVFGPGADLAADVEPEYVAISADGNTAWVAMQENNGVAVVDILAKQIVDILPLGFKDYSLIGNEIDPSNEDGKTELRSVPVFGIYHPDAIAYYQVNGMDYFVTANEGDAREYEGTPGFIEEERIKDVTLDPTAFPDATTLQLEENLGRLKITTTLGDTDGDGDFDELYSFGARSFTIWSGAGQLVYDSGNDIGARTLELTPNEFNGGDGRSDDKGAEPEAVTIAKIGERQILFVGLERNNQVMVYDISNPSFPVFMEILSNSGDVGPEGVLFVDASDSPTGKDILFVSNEVSGTVSIYENN